MAKTLFYSDFDAYRLFGAPITGAQYEKWDHGPYPPRLKRAVEHLESTGRLKLHAASGDYKARRLIPTTQSHADLEGVGLTTREVKLVDAWIDRITRATAAAIRNYSHKFAGYAMVERNDEIPYDSTFLANRRPSSEDVDKARRIAERRGWLVGNKWQRT